MKDALAIKQNKMTKSASLLSWTHQQVKKTKARKGGGGKRRLNAEKQLLSEAAIKRSVAATARKK